MNHEQLTAHPTGNGVKHCLGVGSMSLVSLSLDTQQSTHELVSATVEGGGEGQGDRVERRMADKGPGSEAVLVFPACSPVLLSSSLQPRPDSLNHLLTPQVLYALKKYNKNRLLALGHLTHVVSERAVLLEGDNGGESLRHPFIVGVPRNATLQVW